MTVHADPNVISAYPDAQAVEDGILVSVGDRDRVTRALWEWLCKHLPKNPPSRWPVQLIAWVHAEKAEDPEGARVAAAVGALIDRDRSRAIRMWEDRGIQEYWVRIAGELIYGLLDTAPDNKEDPDVERLWLIPNEIGGVTLMFPSDY